MTQSPVNDTNGPKKLTGRHVLIMLLSAFAVVLTVNVVFAYYAITTNNPRDARNSYEEGIHYNKQIAADRQQEALGWSHKVEIADSRTLRLSFADRAGTPVTGLSVSGRIGRPATDRFNRDLAFAETQPGVYTAATDELEAGGWLASLTATKSTAGGENPVYSVKELLKWHMPADTKRKH